MTVNLLEMKCATPGCWHFRILNAFKNSIYCRCCTYGKCDKFTPQEKAEYRRQLAKAWHKPGPEIAEVGFFSEEQTCLVCGAKRQRRKTAHRWGSWHQEGIGYVTGECPGPPQVIKAIIASERQRPG